MDIVNVVRIIALNGQKQALILRRANCSHSEGLWNLPGGKIDYGRRIFETCQSEFHTETGLTLYDYKPLFVEESLPKNPGEMHCITHYFRATRFGGDLKINHESSEATYIPRYNINKYAFAFGHEKSLEKFYFDFSP